jgi:hypothetical protein
MQHMRSDQSPATMDPMIDADGGNGGVTATAV